MDGLVLLSTSSAALAELLLQVIDLFGWVLGFPMKTRFLHSRPLIVSLMIAFLSAGCTVSIGINMWALSMQVDLPGSQLSMYLGLGLLCRRERARQKKADNSKVEDL